MEALSACYLKDVHQEALGSAVIGIDEGQFVSSQCLSAVVSCPITNKFALKGPHAM